MATERPVAVIMCRKCTKMVSKHVRPLRAIRIQCTVKKIFLSLFSNRMLLIKVGNHKMLVRITNREDPDHTASDEAV